jgi:hypothetical protein
MQNACNFATGIFIKANGNAAEAVGRVIYSEADRLMLKAHL